MGIQMFFVDVMRDFIICWLYWVVMSLVPQVQGAIVRFLLGNYN
jgi:hypothetical protein